MLSGKETEPSENRLQGHSITDILFNPDSVGYIRPNEHILVVGPGIYPDRHDVFPMDRSLMVLPQYLVHGGEITIFDAPQHAEGVGEHSIYGVESCMERMASIIHICPVHYIEGFIAEKNQDVPTSITGIHDHLTTEAFLMMDAKTPENARQIADSVIRWYYSLLIPGGKIFMYYQDWDHIRKTALRESMETLGITVTDISPIIDSVKLPKPLLDRLNISPYMYDGQTGLLRSYHQAKGILIGEK